jgi:hypothetical protein
MFRLSEYRLPQAGVRSTRALINPQQAMSLTTTGQPGLGQILTASRSDPPFPQQPVPSRRELRQGTGRHYPPGEDNRSDDRDQKNIRHTLPRQISA